MAKIKKAADGRRWMPLFLCVFALVFIRFCYYGMQYYLQLDDYIQYHNNAAGGRGMETVVEMGLLAARPLAGVADFMLWSHFFGNLIIAVAIISAMYAASAMLLQSVFERHFSTGGLFAVVYALLPLGFEGTYWLSASSRIAAGLFLAALALWLFDAWRRDGRRVLVPLYAVCQLLAYGLYEQIMVFSFTSVIIIAILRFRENRRALWGLLSGLNAALYLVFVSFFSGGGYYASRTGFVRPWGEYYFTKQLPDILRQIKDVFAGGGFYTLTKGALRGARLLLSEPNVWYILLLPLLCAGLFFLLRRKGERDRSKYAPALIVGALLFIAPLAPFFVIENPWVSLRSAVPSLCGIALIADTLAALALYKVRAQGTVTAVVSACLAFVFCIASVSEIHDYRQTTLNDQRIVARIIETIKRDGKYKKSLKIAVLGIEATYLEDQNYYYHEHINGVTESWWALTGAVECLGGSGRPAVTPMHSGRLYEPWQKETSRLSNFDAVYLNVGDELIAVTAAARGDERYDLYDGAGGYLGHTWEEDGFGYMELAGGES